MDKQALAFGRPRADGIDVSLGTVNGLSMRYEVRRIERGCWRAIIEAGGRPYVWRDLKTRAKARQFCARDFHRRQLVRAA